MKERTRLRAVEPEPLDMHLDLTGVFDVEQAPEPAPIRPTGALEGRVEAIAKTVAKMQGGLNQRDVDHSEQVRRVVTAVEDALRGYQSALAERDTSVEVLSRAIGAVSDQLATITTQVSEAIRHSRQVSTQNDELARHLSGGFHHASQQLAEAATEVRGLLSGEVKVRDRIWSGEIEELRAELREEVQHVRDDIAEELASLRKLLVRQHDEGRRPALAPAPLDLGEVHDAIDAVRADVTSEVAALVTELHEERALVMKQILANQQEMQQLREEVTAAIGGSGGQRSRLDSDISRLLIELRALRRRPTLDAPSADTPRPRLRRPPLKAVTAERA